MDKATYDKMLRVRKAENLKIKKARFLREKLTLKDGSEVDFKHRNYQIQMVFHTLLSKRFIIGDDTGLGKCVTGDTLISTDGGLIPISELHDWGRMEPNTFEPISTPRSVVVHGSKLPVKNFYYGGVKPTKKVTTRYGFEVEGSHVHPLLVKREGSLEWVKTSDLKVGDYLCVERSLSLNEADPGPLMASPIKRPPQAKDFDLPNSMSPKFARFLGYYIGEGTLGSEYAMCISQCPERNPQINADIRNLCEDLFGERPKETKDMQVHGVSLRDFLAANGLDYVGSKSRTIPSCVLRANSTCLIEFCKGLFEAEGSVRPEGGIEFATSSEALSKQLQILLLSFGIVANRTPKKVKGYDHTYWRLTIFGDDARAFQDTIGFVSDRKIDALAESLRKPSNPNHEIIPGCRQDVEDFRSLLTSATKVAGSNSNRKGSGLKQFGFSFVNGLNNIRNYGRDLSYGFLDALLEAGRQYGLEDSSEHQKLQALKGSGYFYDPIVSIEDGEAEVFDIEVDHPEHCFVGNGLMNHNTLEAITTIACLWEKDPDLRVIVVTNTSVMGQWGAEIDKFTKGIRWDIAEGGPDKRADLYEDFFTNWDEDEPRVLIVNYHRLRRDKRVFREFADGHRYALLLDEVTAVKNPQSQTHHVFRELSIAADRVYGLTATLIKNNLEEGFGIFRVVVPELFRTRKGFLRNYCVVRKQRIPGSRRKIEVIVGHTRQHIQDFRRKIDPYYLGRAKHDVADELPVLTTKDVSMRMARSQYLYYQEALDGLLTVNEGTEEQEEKEVTKLTQLIYCQEIVNSPALIGNDVKSGKEEYFLELLKEELQDEKVIVFTRFKAMVDRLQGILEKDQGYKLGIEETGRKQWDPIEDKERVERGLVRITGNETPAMRDAGRRAFTETDNTNLIFLTMAGAEAINLQQARVMIFYDLPWSAGDYIQLVGRMIRIGSPHDRVYAIHLLSETPEGEKTIDHHVRDTLDKKMGYIEQTLGERLVQENPDEMTKEASEEVLKFDNSGVGDLFDLLVTQHKNTKK